MKISKTSLYTACAEYYDLLVKKEDVKKETEFISKLLNKFKVNSVLDVGCGTGLFLIPLKRKGFDAEGLDLSKEMLREARKKDKRIKLHNKSMLDFKINKKYDSIICLGSSLILLPNFKLIEKTLRNFHEHLKLGGIMILDLPNHPKEIRECHNVRDKSSYKTSKGKLDSTFFSYRKGNYWFEEWYGDVKEGNKIFKFKDVLKEFIYSPEELESSLKRMGFELFGLYGSMVGAKFNKNDSYRRIYLCRKLK